MIRDYIANQSKDNNKKREHLEDVLLNLVDDDRIELPTSCL